MEANPRRDRTIRIFAPDLKIPGIKLTIKPNGKVVFETDYNRAIALLSYVKKAIELTAGHIGELKGVDLTVTSTMPVGAGLGTSAAVSVATITAYSLALGHQLEQREIAKLGWRTELEVQGSASPMDTSISTYGGVIYIRRSGDHAYIRELKAPILPVVVGYVPRETTTGVMVARVKRLYGRYPELVGGIIRSIGLLTETAVGALERGDIESVGILMNLNHGLLDALGVSTRLLNTMVYAAREAGAYGAKLTGAGGGGCIVALVSPEVSERVKTAISVVGGRAMDVKMGGAGVIVEKRG